MNFYIDMHCHILPGVDDGAKDVKEMITMLKIACEFVLLQLYIS